MVDMLMTSASITKERNADLSRNGKSGPPQNTNSLWKFIHLLVKSSIDFSKHFTGSEAR